MTTPGLIDTVDQEDAARRITDKITSRVRDEQVIFDRMDEDFDRWTLKAWTPGEEDSISPDDAYTTNAPRVLALKVIAFIASTELYVRISNDQPSTEQQEAVNEAANMLAIGMHRHAEERLKRQASPSIKEALAYYTTVRGRFAAMRSLIRKDERGSFCDMLPLDPRHLVIEIGEEEPVWAAYRMTHTRAQLRRMFPGFEFSETRSDDDIRPEEVWGYYEAYRNPAYDPRSDNPFDRRRFVYAAGLLLNNRFVRPLHDVWAMRFPVVVLPVDAMPTLTPNEKGEQIVQHQGESIFAEDRAIWPIRNRMISYGIDLMAKAADPRKKVMSSDGTMALEEGASEKGAEIQLATANQEDVENYNEADISRAAGFTLATVSQDEVSGSLPPQAFGLLDKPLSSVALRQLGNNLEHRVMPRMKAVASCVEISLSNMLDQYETGGYEPFPVSGRTLEGTRFASKIIEPPEIVGRDPLEVSMQLALPEDLQTIWNVAQMAVSPVGPGGEPLASMEYAREKVLKLPSHKIVRNQNLEWLARSSDPLSQTLEQFKVMIEEGDLQHASIIFDKLQVLAFQRQVEGSMLMAQLQQMAMGLGIEPKGIPGMGPAGANGNGSNLNNNVQLNRQSRNPAFGAPGVAEQRGIGNQPSPQAGYNTTASRNGGQSDTAARMGALGLVMP